MLKESFYYGSRNTADDLIDSGLDALDCYYESLEDPSRSKEYELRLQLFAIAQ